MSTRMLIDARHPEETRVAVVRGNRVEEFDYESVTKRQLKGNIYLAKVTRVEPSLQACFVEYGGNRHGFLAFSEIHPDYYQIPVEDREKLLAEEAEEAKAAAENNRNGRGKKRGENADGDSDVEQVSGDEDIEELPRPRTSALRRRYKIQEVIKRRQVLLIQVVKEERGTKGAALTTYLSLAGRYCVLMPNSPSGGGISRKISSQADRKKLKSVMSALDVPEGMGCIIRTAGLNRTKSEIKRDFDYLLRLWDGIRELTLKSVAPALIYEEGNLIKRSIRDLYTRDVEEILVEGEEGYRTAKSFMKLLMPSHAKKVQNYKDRIPLFHRFQVENQLESMYSPVVQLKSGGYIVINPTEALVAIDVNSGRSTREHNIEETAHKTNLEAADEVARQLRLRDMAGLVVIDFIDMEDRSNIRAVEKRMKDALKTDRARIQLGRLSAFGLMEMSRQRLRPNLLEASMVVCPDCNGTGVVRSTESAALAILRALEEEGIRERSGEVTVHAPEHVATYLLNQKRDMLSDLERQYGYRLIVRARDDLGAVPFEMERVAKSAEKIEKEVVTAEAPPLEIAGTEPAREAAEIAEREEAPQARAAAADEEEDEDRPRKKRRRRRRRGRGRREEAPESAQAAAEAPQGVPPAAAAEAEAGETAPEAETAAPAEAKPEGERPRRRRRRKAAEAPKDRQDQGEAEAAAREAEVTEEPRRGRTPEPEAVPEAMAAGSVTAAEAKAEGPGIEKDKPKPRTRRRKPKAETPAEAAAESKEKTAAPPDKEAAEQPAKAAPRRRKAKAEETAAPAAPSPTAPVAEEGLERAVVTPEGVETEKRIQPEKRRRGWWQRTFGG